MSLVAYAASSDDESESDQEDTAIQVELIKPINGKSEATKKNGATSVQSGGHISDEDDDFVQEEVPLNQLNATNNRGRWSLALPKPKTSVEVGLLNDNEEDVDEVTPALAKLPMPRSASNATTIIEEEDDEFLRKKAIPGADSTLEKPPLPPVKARVQISIPSLKEFSDVDKEMAVTSKAKQSMPARAPNGCGLLSVLPQAKSERSFSKNPDEQQATSRAVPEPTLKSGSNAPRIVSALVPDTVKLRRAAHNTEGVDGVKIKSAKPLKKSAIKSGKTQSNASDSEDDNDAGGSGDFFSLHSEEQLPEVSSNEISALVAQRAAKIVEASNKYMDDIADKEDAEDLPSEESEMQAAQKRYHEQELNNEAMDALVGKNAKRRRKETQGMQIIDISGSQVMPDREEWMRTALATSTSYQPTGVLTDEEPAAGTRRKHQITYLAHKAKANEAELQAMWSANRQTRRATQSKYGF